MWFPVDFGFEPFVRYVAKTTYIINKTVVARDCRIIYILSGEGTVETGDVSYTLSKDTLIYCPYGLPYKFKPYNEMLFYTVNFDFNSENENLGVMTPDFVSKFKPESCLKSIPESCNRFFNRIVCIQNALWAKEYFNTIYEETLSKYEGYSKIQSSCLRNVLIKLYRKQNTTDGLSPVIEKIKDTVKENPVINNIQLADLLGYHPYYLNELFKDKEGITLHQYIIHNRLSKAYELITSSNLSISEIAQKCGFCTQSYFSAAFKKQFGTSPLVLRKQI